MKSLKQSISDIFQRIIRPKKKMLLPEYVDTIDPSIRSLVSFCDDMGLKPISSCSGVLDEHNQEFQYGQLNMLDSKMARKIAAHFIDSGYVKVGLISKPMHLIELYGHKIKDNRINLDFVNLNNEVLPKIEEEIREIVKNKIRVSEEKIEQVNNILNFFNKTKIKSNLTYNFNDWNYENKDTLEFDNYQSSQEMDVTSLVRDMSQENDLEYINKSMDEDYITNKILLPCNKRKEKTSKLINTSLKLAKNKKYISTQSNDYEQDYGEEDNRDFYTDLKNQVNEEKAVDEKNNENQTENNDIDKDKEKNSNNNIIDI